MTTIAVVASAACDRPPSADSLPVWTQADHHSTDDGRTTGAQAPARPDPGAAPTGGLAKRGDVEQLVDLTWRQQCANCHGPMGHGDGPTGPMVQAPDLTRADWQSRITDAEMASAIRNGKNRMPSFNLPDSVLAGLVARIRSLGAREVGEVGEVGEVR